MSYEATADTILANAGEIEARAVAWLEQRDFGPWSPEDEEALEAWLSCSLHHRVAFDRLDLGWQRTQRLTILRQSQTAPATPVSGRSLRWIRSMLVVVVAIGMTALAGWFLLTPDKRLTYTTSVGGREVVRLADGSQIELNTNTSVRVLDRADRREVWLDRGEAYFQVVHDTSRPFSVNAGAQRIADIGTKFLLRRDGDRLKIAVSEGGVRLEASGDPLHSKAIVLRSGDIAVATATSVSVAKEPTSTLTSALAWRAGILVFHHSRLAAAAAEFNRYNQRQIVIADPAVANFEIGGTFPTTDVDGFAAVSRDVLRLHVQTNGQEIWISR